MGKKDGGGGYEGTELNGERCGAQEPNGVSRNGADAGRDHQVAVSVATRVPAPRVRPPSL